MRFHGWAQRTSVEYLKFSIPSINILFVNSEVIESEVIEADMASIEKSSTRLQACAIFAGSCILFVSFIGMVTGRDRSNSLVLPQHMLIEQHP